MSVIVVVLLDICCFPEHIEDWNAESLAVVTFVQAEQNSRTIDKPQNTFHT